jgi:sodium/potassium-transporting ATPase subunit alpha
MLPLEEVCKLYDVKANATHPQTSPGLTASEAAQRLESDGPNMMTPPKGKSALKLFGECLLTSFNTVLLLAAIISFVLQGLSASEEFDPTNVLSFSSLSTHANSQ